MIRKNLFLMLVLATGISFTIAAPAQAEIINTTFDAPMDGDAAFVNCVTGESVPYVQTYHIVANVYTDENGDQRRSSIRQVASDPAASRRYRDAYKKAV